MPASLQRILGGGSVLLHICEVCGKDATFGVGVSYMAALKKLAEGDKISAKRLLGQWFCREHRPSGGDARG